MLGWSACGTCTWRCVIALSWMYLEVWRENMLELRTWELLVYTNVSWSQWSRWSNTGCICRMKWEASWSLKNISFKNVRKKEPVIQEHKQVQLEVGELAEYRATETEDISERTMWWPLVITSERSGKIRAQRSALYLAMIKIAMSWPSSFLQLTRDWQGTGIADTWEGTIKAWERASYAVSICKHKNLKGLNHIPYN